jgi:hypothetical protein
MGASRMTTTELSTPSVPFDPERRIQARSVAGRYDISGRTLDRWLQKPHLEFPQPVMLLHDVAGRVSSRFWRLGDLIAWDRKRATKHTSTIAAG